MPEGGAHDGNVQDQADREMAAQRYPNFVRAHLESWAPGQNGLSRARLGLPHIPEAPADPQDLPLMEFKVDGIGLAHKFQE